MIPSFQTFIIGNSSILPTCTIQKWEIIGDKENFWLLPVENNNMKSDFCNTSLSLLKLLLQKETFSVFDQILSLIYFLLDAGMNISPSSHSTAASSFTDRYKHWRFTPIGYGHSNSCQIHVLAKKEIVAFPDICKHVAQ